jgi:glycosyltransferase involved in cell wall biosynthesis
MRALFGLIFKLQSAYYKRVGYPVVSRGRIDAPKRALLVYLSQGMNWRENDPRLGWHQSLRQSRDLAHLLSERGFRVDVVQYEDSHFIPARHYDLAIVHPGVVSRKFQAIPKTGVRICLRTGRHAAFVDSAMTERMARLHKRRGVVLDWAGSGETDEVYQGYDAIACFDGDGATSATFAAVGLPVFPFRNYPNPAIKFINKDFSKARSGFICVVGHLHVMKGLDWLIEAFADTPARHLYICGKKSPELERLYERELAKPNIHFMGYLDHSSSGFQRLCQCSAWYVSPSASEGCQGTALDMMAAGVLPLLSGACGVSLNGAGILLDPCTPESLKTALDEADRMSNEELRGSSEKARINIELHYASRYFLSDWVHILDDIGV